jgi:hypothetical protein
MPSAHWNAAVGATARISSLYNRARTAGGGKPRPYEFKVKTFYSVYTQYSLLITLGRLTPFPYFLMARVKNNIITQGLSGMLGGTLVFRQQGGRTIVSAAPTEAAGEPSAAQVAQRQRFQEAAIYAKAQITDPASKAAYAAEQDGSNGSAYAIAVADFLKAPTSGK